MFRTHTIFGGGFHEENIWSEVKPAYYLHKATTAHNNSQQSYINKLMTKIVYTKCAYQQSNGVIRPPVNSRTEH
jgi:hypothetical protein